MSWVPFVLLSLVAALLVAAPLIRKVRPPLQREEYDAQVYRDQLRELEQDKERGLLTPEQEEAARLEVDRRLLGVSTSGYRSPGKLPLWQTAIILTLAVPAVSFGLYLWQGSPGTPDQPLSARTQLVNPVQSRQMLEFIAEQQESIAQDPNNVEAWILLGRGYLVSGRFGEAANAFSRAIELGANDPDTQMEKVEALLNETGGIINAPARRAIDAALATDPLHPAARFYQALSRAQAGELQLAFDLWLALAKDSPPDAPWMSLVHSQLQDAAAELGINLEEALPTPLPKDAAAGIAAMQPEEQMQLIRGMVDQLAARLQENPDDAEGWMRLSQSYLVLGQEEHAASAIARAVELRPDDPTVLLQQTALMMDLTTEGDPFPPLVRTNLDRILDLEPANAEALFYAGVASEADGDNALARAFWLRLLDLLEPGGNAHIEVQARIRALPVD